MRGANLRFWATLVVLAVITYGADASLRPAPGHAPDAPRALTVDDDSSPLAVADNPAFGWLPVDRDDDEIQTAYQIVVSDGAHVVADTGKMRSSEQSSVRVDGLADRLLPNHAYTWKVRTWDRTGRPGPYAAAGFVTALRDRDWTAHWVRRAGAVSEPIEDYSYFRKEARIAAAPIVRARVAASAGQQYELFVNGVRLAHGPSFAYPDEQYFETTDITDALRSSVANTFAFETFWGPPSQGRPASVPGLIAQITVEYADGTRQTIVTDGSWRARRAPVYADHPRNDEGDWVERADERDRPVGWDTSGYDDRKWAPAQDIGPAGTAPFTHLVAARTHTVESAVQPERVTKVGNVYVADFGAIVAATPVVHLAQGRTGDRVTLVGGDRLDPNGLVSRTKGNQDTDMSWLFDTRAGPQVLRPFGYLGFRYLEVDGALGHLDRTSITAAARHAAMPDENGATFDSADPTLNAVWKLARHSALYDSQEQFLDTPTREKGPFLGDGFDVSQATMVAFRERALTAQALRDFARSQTRYWPDGRVNVVYPNGDGKRDIPDATQTYVEWVWQYYVTTGDRQQLAALYPTVKRISSYVEKAVDPKTGLVTNLPGGGEDYMYGAVDWPPWMRYGYDMTTAARTPMNVLAVNDFRRVAAMGHILGDTTDADLRTAWADRLTRAMLARLRRPDGVWVDGLLADGKQSAHAGQQANAWPLAFGIVPPADVPTVADHVVSLKNAMGVVYFRVLLDALHAAGRDDALVASLTDPKRPGYAQILKQGATFTWESWIAPAVGDSESHGWGSTVLAVMLTDIAGIRITEPGASHVEIAAPNANLANARGSVSTQRGVVSSSWTRDAGGHETLAVTIPVNVTATVRIGDRTAELGSGHWELDSTKPLPRPTSSSSGRGTTAGAIAIALIAIAAAVVGVTFVMRRRRLRRA